MLDSYLVSIVRPKFKVNEKGETQAKTQAETQEQEFNNDGINRDDSPIDFLLTFDKKFTMAVEGLEPFFEKILRKMSKGNALIIVEYINTARREINISDGHRKSKYTDTILVQSS